MVLFALTIVVLLGMAAMAIDVGQWLVARRSLQAAADAAALAGASRIPGGMSGAQSTAQAQYVKNGQAGDTVDIQPATDGTQNDSIVVTASRSIPSIFAGVLGIGSETISASARATVFSFGTVISHGDVMPWGVLKQSFVPGQTYDIYAGQDGSPTNGTLLIPSKPNCSGGGGTPDYKAQLAGTAVVCDLHYDDIVQTKGGASAGLVSQGIGARITTFQPIDQVVRFYSNGYADILNPASKQLVTLPVVVNMSGQPSFPSGGGNNMQVKGFANFFITAVLQSGKQVEGVFLGTSVVDDQQTTRAWDPAGSTLYTYRLTR